MVSSEDDVTAFAAVEDALRSAPLVPPPPLLRRHVLEQISSLPPAPRFRLEWLDYALSLFAAGLVGVVVLLWQSLAGQAAGDPELQGQLAFWLDSLGSLSPVLGIAGMGLAMLAGLGVALVLMPSRALESKDI